MPLNIRRVLSLGVIVALAMVSPAMGQRYEPFGPVWDDFGHDFAIFSPAEISSFDGGPDPKIGFFLEWSRMYVDVNRSSASFGPTQGDWTWGNRYTGGYMHPDDYGWLVEYIHVDGPSNGRRFDSFNQDNADPQQGVVIFDPRPNENLGKFNSIEVSRMWRLPQLHEGSNVELFGGIRFARFEQWDVFSTEPIFPFPIVSLRGMSVKNDMYGGQFGLRWYKQKGRWVISAEGRYFYAYNHQNFAEEVISGELIDGTPYQLGGVNPKETSEDTWTSAGDVRIDVNYQLTKAFALSIGWEMLYFGRGVARAAPPFDDQDLLITGVTFGLSVNR